MSKLFGFTSLLLNLNLHEKNLLVLLLMGKKEEWTRSHGKGSNSLPGKIFFKNQGQLVGSKEIMI